MGRYASGGGRPALRGAARSYVGAHGGANRAARSARVGRTTTGRLSGFLADVAQRGAGAAAEALTLVNVLGRPVEAVLAVLADVLAPAGDSLEDATTREMVDDVLCYLYERYALAEGIAGLDAMDADGIREATRVSVASYIYRRWLQELGGWIERGAVTAREAVRLEREVKDYVNEAVRLDLSGYDVVRMDWSNPDSQGVVERIYAEAYSLLETYV